MHPRTRPRLLMYLTLTLALTMIVRGEAADFLKLDESVAEQTVDASLNKSSRFAWYQDGKLRPISLSKDPELVRPSFDWKWDTKQQTRPRRAPATTPELNWLSEAMRSFIWILFAVTIALLLYYWLTRLARQQMAGDKARGESRLPRSEADLIEQLPFQVETPKSDLLAEAKRQYEAGNYNLAIVYLYSHQLVQLDRHDKIRLTKGKTNRQYLFELRRNTPLNKILSRTVLAFEDAFFGRHDLDAQRFDACWSELGTFSTLLADDAAIATS